MTIKLSIKLTIKYIKIIDTNLSNIKLIPVIIFYLNVQYPNLIILCHPFNKK